MSKTGKITAALLLLCVFLFSPNAFSAEKTIGVIMTGDIPFYKDIHKAFSEELKRRGIKVEILVQTPSPETMAWINAARKLVAVNVDVIVTYGAPGTMAALSETSSIPIIFAGVFDPEGVDVSKKKNVTGISSKVSIIGVVKILKDILDFKKLGVIYNDSERDTVKQADEIDGLTGKLSFQAVRFKVKKFGDSSKIKDVDALFLTSSCSAQQCADDVIGTARKQQIPTAAVISGSEEKGIILTISANPEEQGHEAAEMLSRVIAGEKPSAIQVRMPKKVEMILNLKEAATMGLKVPFDVMTSATKVIK